MGDLSNFETGQILGAHLAVASVTSTTTLLGVSRTTVSNIMSAYTNHGKATPVKRTEKDCFEKSQKTAAQVTEQQK
jgi:uncharacterized cupin superfamily protein